MSNQPSTSAAYHQQLRWTDSEDSNSDDEDDQGRMTSKRAQKTHSGSDPFTQSGDHPELSDGNVSDDDVVETPSQRRRPGRPRKDEVKSRAALQARSKGGQFVKKSKADSTDGLADFPAQGDDESDSEEEEGAQSPKKKQAKMEDDSRAKAVSGEQARKQNQNRKKDRKKRALWVAAEAAQAARDLERAAKRERPLNRHIRSRPSPPPPETDSEEEPTVPPPPTEKELAARKAYNEERRRLYWEKKEKREQEMARKRELERNRRLFPDSFSRKPARGSIGGVFSTRTTDREGKTTTWEQWRRVIWCDEEEKAQEWKRRVKENRKQIRKLKPRTGPAFNNGLYAVESRRLLEKEEDSGFHQHTHKIKKEEKSDSEDDEKPKIRNHSETVKKILEEEFNDAQYLDQEMTKRIMRTTKLKRKQVTDWFANNRRKVQNLYKNGKIAELPGQMKALEEKNKEREERGEHLRMRDPEESDVEKDEEDYEDDVEDSGDDLEEEPEVDERFEAVGSERAARLRQIDHLSTVGYPVFPAPKASRTTQNGGGDDRGGQEARIRQLDPLSTVGYPVFPAPKASRTG
ncbi:hypothetical protein CAEBREN_14518 [Caenorhabditis brenneri]|uniref:Homeobox domain-containing protein n=1 Tax=Caenorhabditis brenneri TaxID=135651 RepID=G0MCW4_CAEBE|nr:hypothetical protein CAEBREN_14518 [Caenorhabditis brenneri]